MMIETKSHRTIASTLIGLALLCATNRSLAQAPTAPDVTGPDYSVSYTSAYGAEYSALQEKYGASGQWVDVHYNGGTVPFSGKPAGEYFYRKMDMYVYYPEWWWEPPYYSPNYSAETRVVVTAGGPVPPIDSLLTQLGYQYEARYGDGDGNGLLDLFVSRVSGGQDGNGTLGQFLLLQNWDQSFSAVAADGAQIVAASSWPVANVDLRINDVDLDGFVDLNIIGIGGLIGGALDQIVFAPGQVLSVVPSGVRAVTWDVTTFLRDSRNWQYDPNYFAANAFTYAPVYAWWAVCDNGYSGPAEYASGYGCYYFYTLIGYYSIFNTSAYSWDAYELSGAWSGMEAAEAIFANTTNAIILSNVFERIFGRKPFKGVIIAAGGDGITIPGDIPIPDAPPDTDVKPRWRWLRIFTVVTIEIEALDYLRQFRPLLRIVDAPELADIHWCQCFRTLYGGLEVKQFWMDAIDAEWWATVGMTRYTAADGLRGSNRVRTMVFTWVRQTTWQIAMPPISEPPTKGHLDYYEGSTLVVLNQDIATSPFGRIKMLRQYPPLDVLH
jgi:hypothetical protein